MVYLHYISYLRYTILVGNPRYGFKGKNMLKCVGLGLRIWPCVHRMSLKVFTAYCIFVLCFFRDEVKNACQE